VDDAVARPARARRVYVAGGTGLGFGCGFRTSSVSHLADKRHDGPWRERAAVRIDRVEGVGERGVALGGIEHPGSGIAGHSLFDRLMKGASREPRVEDPGPGKADGAVGPA
jgi:hypothetical protein